MTPILCVIDYVCVAAPICGGISRAMEAELPVLADVCSISLVEDLGADRAR